MGAHHCHLPGCKAACPPRFLMCPYHWFMLPGHLMTDVYATVNKRGPSFDATWAPWWRAQAAAIGWVLHKIASDPNRVRGLALPPEVTADEETFRRFIDKFEAREAAFADILEKKDAST